MTRCEGCKIAYDEDYQYCLQCGKPLMADDNFPTVRMDLNASKPNTTNRSKNKPSNVINFDRSSNKGIVANKLTIKTTNKSVRLNPPAGIIASDANMRGYAKYLIDKYHEFRKWDETIGKMRFAPIYTPIRRQFKCKWDYVPVDRFLDLVRFLQVRIDKTVMGQSLKKKGQGRYESYDEWLRTR